MAGYYPGPCNPFACIVGAPTISESIWRKADFIPQLSPNP
jgi:hypothetical protein